MCRDNVTRLNWFRPTSSLVDRNYFGLKRTSSRWTCARILGSSRRAQVLLLCYRRNYDRSIAGLGPGRAQRYVASDFDRLSSGLFDANRAAVSRTRPIAPRYCTHSASTAMQYRIEQKLTKARYTKLPELFQPVEKNRKCASSRARIVCRPKIRLDRFELQK